MGRRGKAVADGAVSFFLDHYISVRVARVTLGIKLSLLYDKNKEDHRRRSNDTWANAAGTKLVKNSFRVILAKVKRIVHR